MNITVPNLAEVAKHFAVIGKACDDSEVTVLLRADSEISYAIMGAIMQREDAARNEIIVPIYNWYGEFIIVAFLLASDTNIKILGPNGRRNQSLHIRPRDSAPIEAAAMFSDGLLGVWVRRIPGYIMIYSFVIGSLMKPICNETRPCDAQFDTIVAASMTADSIRVRAADRVIDLRYRGGEYIPDSCDDTKLIPDRAYKRF